MQIPRPVNLLSSGLLLLLILPAAVVGQPPATISADVKTLVEGNTAFACDLYHQLRQDKENQGNNLFFSPYSISTALAMTYGGARGETATQMAKVLHYRLAQQAFHPACAELTRTLNGHGLPRDYHLNVVHALWGQGDSAIPAGFPSPDTLPFVREYEKLIRTHYGVGIRRVDFKKAPEAAQEQINRWVEERTHQKIKQLLQAKDIDNMTRLVLVNALTFKAAWDTPFSAEYTKDAAFETGAGKPAQVKMMYNLNQFRGFYSADFQALELPYEGNDLAMVVLLPRKKDGLAKLEEALTPANLAGWLAELKRVEVDVKLPKFKITSRFNLKKSLMAMGMPAPFSRSADFSGMTTADKLEIDKVIHKAFVGVDEQGTEAAAATAVILASRGDRMNFHADHPFVFLIRDTRTGTILFLGRVTDPTVMSE